MALTEDFSVFFDDEDFAVTASFTPRTGGAASSVTGIFDAEFVVVDGGGDVEVADTAPMFTCAESDVPNARGGTLVVGGTTYDIVTPKPDGTGVVMLQLEEQA